MANNKNDLGVLGRDIKKLQHIVDSKFPTITYTKALEILNENGAEKSLKEINLDTLIGLINGFQKFLERLKT